MTDNTEGEKARIAAHEEAVSRYGPIQDYETLPYQQMLAFEHGAIWARQQLLTERRADMTAGLMRAVVSAAGVDDEVFHRWLDQHDRELWEAAWAQGRGSVSAGEGI